MSDRIRELALEAYRQLATNPNAPTEAYFPAVKAMWNECERVLAIHPADALTKLARQARRFALGAGDDASVQRLLDLACDYQTACAKHNVPPPSEEEE